MIKMRLLKDCTKENLFYPDINTFFPENICGDVIEIITQYFNMPWFKHDDFQRLIYFQSSLKDAVFIANGTTFPIIQLSYPPIDIFERKHQNYWNMKMIDENYVIKRKRHYFREYFINNSKKLRQFCVKHIRNQKRIKETWDGGEGDDAIFNHIYALTMPNY